ncbi:SH2 domain-containing adapter protein F-like isoform X2 [Scleropages formosus]|uniref:Src homology 2 domain containing F n=1 Tax=Scleropages formosus TaxID=113540 RepID=A0A8C9WJ69_SCLFO|nr:SH2 domain-containing adapter protein F-like isoform X2 [Scleropages formosus]
MARWFKEHLPGFKSSKASPPAPPKPDYRHCHMAACGGGGDAGGAPGFQQTGPGATCQYPSAAQPDILAAYKLQKELDFEDPYTAGGNLSFPGFSSLAAPDVKYVSPKHRLIKVETLEKSGAGTSQSQSASAAGARSPPSSPPTEQDGKEKVIILEDYADPFDAKQGGGGHVTPEKVAENDGYMEPYEAQKMMAEIRGGRSLKDGPLRQPPLYDTPYEPAENGGDDSDPERPLYSRESRLPQDDERPPEEYDQPWEWKRDRISKAFAALLCYDCFSMEATVADSGSASCRRHEDVTSKSLTVHFDGVDKSQTSPTKEGKARHPRRHSSGCLVNTKLGSLDQCHPTVGERIDPSLPLESQFWYHGAISRTDAESLLRLCKEASYLVRNSETSKNDFSLSLKSSQGFMHMKLSRTKENKYVLGQNSSPFDSVPEIIHFYSSRKLPIKGAEHMSLLYPVAIRTL